MNTQDAGIRQQWQNSHKGGFTLLETIVAIIILSVTISAFISAVVKSLQVYEDARLRFTAARIAQEGMELVYSKVTNHVNDALTNPPVDWKTNLVGDWEADATKPDQLDPSKKFDAVSGPLRYICVIANPPQDKGKYGYCKNGGDVKVPGDFTRDVQVLPIGGAYEKVRIVVTIRWKTRISSEQYSLESAVFGTPHP